MSQTLEIIVDDTDPAITYTGNWITDRGSVDNLGNYGSPYMSTNHYTKGTGSFSYTFFGTYVGVFGTTLDGNDPVRECLVDGVKIPNNSIGAAENWFMHCQVNGLSDGKHTIVVNVPSPNPSGYWFDYIVYLPSASVSKSNANLLIINGDPSMSFGSGWNKNGPGYIAQTAGATFNMQFTGRSLTWMGYYLSQLPYAATTATYSVDGGSPVTFNLNGIKSQNTGAEFNQRFFTTPTLGPGTHNLKVVYNGNSGTTPLSIYNVVIQANGGGIGGSTGGSVGGGGGGGGGSSNPPTVTVTGAPPTTTITNTLGSTIPSGPQSSTVVVYGTGASAVTVTVPANSTATQGTLGSTGTLDPTETATGSSPNASDKASTGSSSSNAASGSSGSAIEGSANAPNDTANKGHGNIGLIAGVVAGVIVLLLLLLAIWFRRRRRQRKRAKSLQAPPMDDVVRPFTDMPLPSSQTELIPAAEVSPTESSGRSERSESIYTSYASPQPYTNEKQQLAARYASNSSTSHAPSRSFSTTFSAPSTVADGSESEIIMVHQDSGMRLPLLPTDRPTPTIVEMPPSYSAN